MRKKVCIVLIWILLWELAARLAGSRLLLAGPRETLMALFSLAGTAAYRGALLKTALRVLSGFLAGSLTAAVLAAFSYRFSIIRDFLSPAVTLLRSVPVVSFIILVLIWAGHEAASVVISAFVCFPIVYQNTLNGLLATDPKLLEMAEVFRIPLSGRMRAIYLPQLRPFLESALSLAVGMGFKSGIAAEVLAQPAGTVGNGLYRSKIFLDTAEMFAWTFSAVVLCRVLELCVHAAVSGLICRRQGKAFRRRTGETAFQKKEGALPADLCRTPGAGLSVSGLSKAYGKLPVLQDFSFRFEPGGSYLLSGRSGIGKTTLLRLLMGLETAESGSIVPEPGGLSFSAAFQEDRLIGEYTVLENILLIKPVFSTEEIREAIRLVLPEDVSGKPVSALSGGMKRRAAVLRAVLAHSDVLILDEPFTGLDPESREKTLGLIRRFQGERLLILTSHEDEGLDAFSRVGIPDLSGRTPGT